MLNVVKQIENLLPVIGTGILSPDPYNTAICAWIPRLDNELKPQFPECLEWLRNRQLSDGSWGTDKPIYSYGNILSTLASIIALKKWNQNIADIKLIEDGERSLFKLVNKLFDETYESIGFELILPMLLKEAEVHKLNIPYSELNEFRCLFDEKMNLIKQFHKKFGWSRRHAFWFSIEMLGALTEPSDIELFKLDNSIIEENGSILDSPSATAYYLYITRTEYGLDEPKAYNYLKNIIHRNNGGASNVGCIDTFELSFSLKALLLSGFIPNNTHFNLKFNGILEKWREFDGWVGFSTYSVPDVDLISNFIFVINKCNRSEHLETLSRLLTFFHEDHFLTYGEERNPSISSNINALIALKSYSNRSNQIKDLMNKLVDWLRSNISKKVLPFEDKWHLSPFYATSMAVFALHSLDNNLADICVNRMIETQNSDKGFGINGSTLEETALVSLALCFWFNTNKDFNNNVLTNNLEILESIECFFDGFNGKPYVELWIGKSLYCPVNVVKMFVLSAKYSLNKTLDLIRCNLIEIN